MDFRTPHFALGAHQYAVIDRKRVPELPQSWPVIELILPMMAPQAHLYPWLVPLRELPSQEWEGLMTTLSRHSGARSPEKCSLLLSSACSPEQVRSALVNALYFKDSQHNGHILRFYDPRVLFHLHWMLTPWQLTSLLTAKDIPCWTFWLEGGWHTLEYSRDAVSMPGAASAINLQQLALCGPINQALQQLPACSDIDQRQQISRKLADLLRQASECGLYTDEDRIAFALHGLVQRQGFWNTPKMSAFLQQASQNADLYRSETSSWDETRWQEMTGTQTYTAGSTF